MKVLWAVLCRGAVVSQQTNNVTLFEVLEEVQVSASAIAGKGEWKPLTPSLELVVTFARNDESIGEKATIKIGLRSPGVPELLFSPKATETVVDMTSFLRFRLIAQVGALPVSGAGTYTFVVLNGGDSRWVPMAELPLRLTILGEDAPTAN